MKNDFMKKLSKNKTVMLMIMSGITLISIILFCISAGLFTRAATKKASAAAVLPPAMFDDNFEFTDGAAISKYSTKSISFLLNVKNGDLNPCKDHGRYIFKITLNRVNTDSTLSPCSVTTIDYKKNYQKDFFELLYNTCYVNTEYFNGYTESLSTDNINDTVGLTFTDRQARFCFKVDSVNVSYQINFSYSCKIPYSGPDLMGGYKRNLVEGNISSAVRSYGQIIVNMNNAGALETEFKNDPTDKDNDRVQAVYTFVKDVLHNQINQVVEVSYLENVKGTPFAIKKKATFETKVLNNSISRDDVASKLNIGTLDILQSVCIGFAYNNANKIYNATYSKSVWLSAKTTDGNSLNYFLDCNKSYQDFYRQFVTDGIFSNDLYEYIFYSKIILKYKALAGLAPADVYGYFGYVVIPDTKTLNTLWKDLFNVSTTYSGIINNFMYSELLNWGSYQKLLKDYQYTWLERVWNGILTLDGSTAANHYIIFADNTGDDGFIGENGGDNVNDNDSVIGGNNGLTGCKKPSMGCNKPGASCGDSSGYMPIMVGCLIAFIIISVIKNNKKGGRK